MHILRRKRHLERIFINHVVLKARPIQALWASRVTIRKFGLKAFAIRALRWLRGERTYYKKTGFELLIAEEPTATDLRLQVWKLQEWDFKPIFSIATLIDAPFNSAFESTLQSVLSQTYPHWKWYIGCNFDEKMRSYVLEQVNGDARIILCNVSPTNNRAEKMNALLQKITEEYVVILNEGDSLAPFALYAVASEIQQDSTIDIAYSDIDFIDEHQKRTNPQFKPDWSPEMMLGYNLLEHLSVLRRHLLNSAGYLDGQCEDAAWLDLYLRLSQCTSHICHIAQILYHVRAKATTGDTDACLVSATEARQQVLERHLQRIGLTDPKVSYGPLPVHIEHPRIRWQVPNPRRISIIIPSRDHATVLMTCLTSIFDLTTYPDYEVILVDTGSKETATKTLYLHYETEKRFKLVHFDKTFNFSEACNFGAQHADGELLLFLNNDTQVLQADWLTLMAQWFEIKEIGAVGPKLLYPNGTIQQAGVSLRLGVMAGHLFAQQQEFAVSPFGTDGWYRDLLAVTGACVMVPRPIYEQIKGFDEGYKLIYSDIELCLQIHRLGYRVLYTPHVRLLHHESLTHKRLIPRADLFRAFEQWTSYLQFGDPYFNRSLSGAETFPSMRKSIEQSAYERGMVLLKNLPAEEMVTADDLKYWYSK
jgi:O-antigen biosynthesis protein